MTVYVVERRADRHVVAVYASRAAALEHIANHQSFDLDELDLKIYEMAA